MRSVAPVSAAEVEALRELWVLRGDTGRAVQQADELLARVMAMRDAPGLTREQRDKLADLVVEAALLKGRAWLHDAVAADHEAVLRGRVGLASNDADDARLEVIDGG